MVTVTSLAGDSQVEVQVMRGWNQDRSYHGLFYRVRLRSDRRPMAVSLIDVPANVDRLEYRIEIAAGALAEHQCLTLGDRHDPSLCGKAALELLRDLKAGPLRCLPRDQGL